MAAAQAARRVSTLPLRWLLLVALVGMLASTATGVGVFASASASAGPGAAAAVGEGADEGDGQQQQQQQQQQDDSATTWKDVEGGDSGSGGSESGFSSPERSKLHKISPPGSGSSRSPLGTPTGIGGRGRTSSNEIIAMYGPVGSVMTIPDSFDYLRSTEDNYGFSATGGSRAEPQQQEQEQPQFVGKYKEQRAVLDYDFHRFYTTERQLFHDRMIDLFHNTRVEDTDNDLVCDRPLENWIVFTAGPMGAGKGHTMQWLQRAGLFPLAAFVKVDPDSLRELLPETPEYIRRNPTTAGRLTQKEVGYIAEVLTLDALQQGKNVLVDGSLKDADWYLAYVATLRQQFPRLKVAILHVTASRETVLARCRRRAETTGRVVPEEVLVSAMNAIPNALRQLAPKVDYFATFENEEEEGDPKLLMASKAVSTNDLAALLDADMAAAGAGAGGPRREEVFARPGDSEWQERFKTVWKMQCALPPPKNKRAGTATAAASASNEL